LAAHNQRCVKSKFLSVDVPFKQAAEVAFFLVSHPYRDPVDAAGMNGYPYLLGG
jgi:hypothetical protein